jgi:chemotaxis protein CheD
VEQHLVRMGEFAVSGIGGATLVTIGLGSCIGLALVDGRVAGLAHVVLPDSTGAKGELEPGKFADTAVPALLEGVTARGAARTRLSAVLVGGASMFSFATATEELDIGNRNAAAVAERLERHRIRITATATGGAKGRTVRVYPDGGLVVAKEAGGMEFELHRSLEVAA